MLSVTDCNFTGRTGEGGCCKKYVVLCCLCGGLSAAVGSLFLAVHAVLSAHTASLALFETVPSYIPGIMVRISPLTKPRPDTIKHKQINIIGHIAWCIPYCFAANFNGSIHDAPRQAEAQIWTFGKYIVIVRRFYRWQFPYFMELESDFRWKFVDLSVWYARWCAFLLLLLRRWYICRDYKALENAFIRLRQSKYCRLVIYFYEASKSTISI